jgi:hypothetical protein
VELAQLAALKSPPHDPLNPQTAAPEAAPAR